MRRRFWHRDRRYRGLIPWNLHVSNFFWSLKQYSLLLSWRKYNIILLWNNKINARFILNNITLSNSLMNWMNLLWRTQRNLVNLSMINRYWLSLMKNMWLPWRLGSHLRDKVLNDLMLNLRIGCLSNQCVLKIYVPRNTDFAKTSAILHLISITLL